MTTVQGSGNTQNVQASAAQAAPPPPPYEPSKAMTLSVQERTELDALAGQAASGVPGAAGKLERLENLYHAREMSKLASDVYYHDDNAAVAAGDLDASAVRRAPEGWQRASATPELLARYGLTEADLNPGDESGFRAELYVPDPNADFRSGPGGNAEPVLVFKGTNPTSTDDWSANLTQSLGQPTDYYNRAMKVADKLDAKTDGGFTISGHSLGGGMASAAAAVTGEEAVTFNAAGLHDATAARFLEGRGVVPTAPRETTTAYIVDGEFLDSTQRGTKALDPASADRMVETIQGGVAAADNLAGKIDGLADSRIGRRVLGDDTRARIDDAIATLSQVKQAVNGATGADLRALPTAAGNVVRLDALNADGTARAVNVPDVAEPGGFVDQAERVVGEAGEIRADTIEKYQTWDRRLGSVDEWVYGGNGLEDYGNSAGNLKAAEHILNEAGGLGGLRAGGGVAGEAVARHGMDVARNGLDAAIAEARGN